MRCARYLPTDAFLVLLKTGGNRAGLLDDHGSKNPEQNQFKNQS